MNRVKFEIDDELNKQGWKVIQVFGLSAFGFVLILIVILYSLSPSRKESLEKFKNDTLERVIIRKYIDYRNHANQVIIYKTEAYQGAIYGRDWKNVFEVCEPGDTVLKAAGQLNLKVYNGQTQKSQLLEYVQ
jgi:hypothetical protein